MWVCHACTSKGIETHANIKTDTNIQTDANIEPDANTETDTINETDTNINDETFCGLQSQKIPSGPWFLLSNKIQAVQLMVNLLFQAQSSIV